MTEKWQIDSVSYLLSFLWRMISCLVKKKKSLVKSMLRIKRHKIVFGHFELVYSRGACVTQFVKHLPSVWVMILGSWDGALDP